MTCRDGSRQDQARIPEKQLWVRFGGKTNLMDVWRGSGGKLEEAARDTWVLPTGTKDVSDGGWESSSVVGGLNS